MHEITMEDINGYLATKKYDEVIGNCMNASTCLAHNTLAWKYGLEASDVDAYCTFAIVAEGRIVEFPQDVAQAVSKFDRLKPADSPVTKAEFLAVFNLKSGGANER